MESSRNIVSWRSHSSRAFQSLSTTTHSPPVHQLLQKISFSSNCSAPPTKPTNRFYDNMHRHRAFLLTCNHQPFSISSTHLLNRKNAETRMREESACVDYGFNLEKFKKHMIRRVKKNRELQPHIVHSKPKYQGLKAMQVPDCSQHLLNQLKHMSADPQKNSRKRLFKSNFRFDRTCISLMPSTPADQPSDNLRLSIE